MVIMVIVMMAIMIIRMMMIVIVVVMILAIIISRVENITFLNVPNRRVRYKYIKHTFSYIHLHA